MAYGQGYPGLFSPPNDHKEEDAERSMFIKAINALAPYQHTDWGSHALKHVSAHEVVRQLDHWLDRAFRS